MGGDVNINVRDTLTISGTNSGVFTSLGFGAVGRGGNINIQTGSLSLTNDAQLNTSSFGQGNAGNLRIAAQSIRLDKGQITAQSATGEGGNTNLSVQDLLLLRHNSLISNTNGTVQTGGNEGRFTLNTKFLVAFPLENSDIITNAFNGSGGKIDITASGGIFGFVLRTPEDLVRLQGTNDSAQLNPRNLPTNDIVAISRLSPTIITTPEVDPSRRLVELPVNVVDPTTLIAQNPCQRGNGNEFTITGRGGLPSNPNQVLAGDNVRVDLVTSASSQGNFPSTSVNLPLTTPTVKRLVPAQGWVFNDFGQVVLTAYDPTNTGSQRSWREPASCAKR